MLPYLIHMTINMRFFCEKTCVTGNKIGLNIKIKWDENEMTSHFLKVLCCIFYIPYHCFYSEMLKKNDFEKSIIHQVLTTFSTLLFQALDTFNTAVVTPIYYVFFTSFVIMGSAILFQEFFKMDILNIIGDACGFLTIVAGIFLLNAFKDMKISWRNIPNATKSSDTGAAKSGNAEDDVFTNGTSLGMNGVGVTNTNYILDCQDIEARISRNMSAECITRNMSEESDCNDNNRPLDRYHGSSPVQEF